MGSLPPSHSSSRSSRSMARPGRDALYHPPHQCGPDCGRNAFGQRVHHLRPAPRLQLRQPVVDLALDRAHELVVLRAVRRQVLLNLVIGEDTDSTYDDIARLFGATVADIVDGVTKLTRVTFSTMEEEQAYS